MTIWDTDPPSEWCPLCGWQVPLRENGTLRTHYPLGGSVACAGLRPECLSCQLRPDIRRYRLLAGTQWKCPTCGTLWVVWPGPSTRNRQLEWATVSRLSD